MADKNIGALPQAGDLYDDSLFVVEHSGEAKNVSGKQIKDFAKQGVDAYVTAAQKAAQDAAAAAEQTKTDADAAQAGREAAQTAQAAAETAEQGAAAARTAIENMLVEAVTLATGEPAAVTKELVDGVVKLVFGLPAGAQGDKGDTGSSISKIERTAGTGAPGTTDTYTITMTDGGTFPFQVYNGADGIGAGDFMANGTVPMTGNLQMGGNRITGLAAPVEDGDAVRKADLAGLTVTTDAAPTEGSTNPVQSGGVFDALAAEETARAAHEADQTNPHGVTAEQVGIGALPLKTASPADADTYVITDSADENKLKRTAWSVIKSVLASIFAPITSPVFTGSISLGRKAGTTVGSGSFAIGSNLTASGKMAHAEGHSTIASGEWCSHAEGFQSEATESYAHAEGQLSKATAPASHAEGYRTQASRNCAHAEGNNSKASGDNSHSEGDGTVADGYGSHAEGSASEATGNYAHVEGRGTKASGQSSHAEGDYTSVDDQIIYTVASAMASHAEGIGTSASSSAAHAEGSLTIASGVSSHAEGYNTDASGYYAHAEGWKSRAKGECAHAAGCDTVANDYQYVLGRCNKESTDATQSSGDRFIIGSGTSGAPRNIFRVHSSGTVYGGQYNSSGADYAELFEWLDGNTVKEDRAGLFVTLDGERIRLAGPGDGYILGIVSAAPSVVGDVEDDQWHGMYLKDVFGRVIMEMRDIPTETAPDGTVLREARRELGPKLNPDYDPTEPYLPRSKRPEWDAVGMMGKLVAVDDGTCQPNGYCKVGEGGVATRSDTPTPYRVLGRLDDNHVRVLIR